MKLMLLDNRLEFPNKEDSVEVILNEINKILEGSHYFFSHFIIDGVEVYDDYEDYLFENIEVIEEVRVEVKKLKELIEEVLESTKEYVHRALPLIKDLGEAFYQVPKEASWQNLADLFGGIQWMLESFSNIDRNKQLEEVISSYELWNEYAQQILKLNEIIPDLQQAVENQDIVLIGDILSYEISPIFEEMLQRLQRLMPEGVNDGHVN
ncbi:hypothetical protein [Clostridium formicaceticum]|uniref:Uncharacterized protein n=1 Tax=Clostridium formicaceticum TaxID=1497 RepID=A0AAC9RI71_9CLOT|nr:hypothetical protein [Clostridium formicaceticum]AOY75646.1 hypothetical protein BJL90_06910 [Clostridium formicaceticum]ARE85960.1 hypothetical protein CLFO_02760 [Clostridium formicaceticum]